MSTHTFYHTDSVYSNFHPSPFELDGKTFRTAEAGLMFGKAMLFGDCATAEKILAAETPLEAKRLGRTVAAFDEAVWVEHREDVMERVLWAKFTQNEQPRKKLLALAKDCRLVEASPSDRIWGVGRTAAQLRAGKAPRGLNLLGKALNRVKRRLEQGEQF